MRTCTQTDRHDRTHYHPHSQVIDVYNMHSPIQASHQHNRLHFVLIYGLFNRDIDTKLGAIYQLYDSTSVVICKPATALDAVHSCARNFYLGAIAQVGGWESLGKSLTVQGRSPSRRLPEAETVCIQILTVKRSKFKDFYTIRP